MKNLAKHLLIAILGGIIAVSLFNIFYPQKIELTELPQQTTFITQTATSGSSEDFTLAAEMTVNAVVHVKTVFMQQSGGYLDPFRQFFYGGQPQAVLSSGSGVIISKEGYIVTNNHVVEGAEKVEITLNNKETFDAIVIGNDPLTDLAVLKIEQDNLPYVGYANSDAVKVGEWVLAVGNPFNLTSTVTAGIVSAKGRDINILNRDPSTGLSSIESFIQTDAAVNPGNSGGALVNTKGELIGINAAIKSNTGSYTGYSFAIPSNLVKKVVADLIEFGDVQRAFIGVSIQEITKELAESENLGILNGVYVADVLKDGAAAQSGIKKGDVIVQVGEIKINTGAELQGQVGQFRPGDKIPVVVWRDGKEIKIPIQLRNIAGNTDLNKKEEIEIHELLGAQLQQIDASTVKRLEIDGGVQVKRIYPGKLRSIGINEGFIITHINNKKIKSLDELNAQIDSDANRGILIEGIYPNGKRAYYGFGV